MSLLTTLSTSLPLPPPHPRSRLGIVGMRGSRPTAMHDMSTPHPPPVPPQSIHSTRRHPYARKSASRTVLSRMQHTLYATRRTPHGASLCLVLAMSVWSVKTRRAPPRHCRDARVYGPTTTAMHDMSTHAPCFPSFRRSSFLHALEMHTSIIYEVHTLEIHTTSYAFVVLCSWCYALHRNRFREWSRRSRWPTERALRS